VESNPARAEGPATLAEMLTASRDPIGYISVHPPTPSSLTSTHHARRQSPVCCSRYIHLNTPCPLSSITDPAPTGHRREIQEEQEEGRKGKGQ
jgi:hypothetical protein